MQEQKILVAIDPDQLQQTVKEMCFEWFLQAYFTKNRSNDMEEIRRQFERMFGETKIKI